MKDDKIFLGHIIECINLIDEFSSGVDKKKFLKDKKTQSSVIRQIEIIGEAVKNISLKLRKKHRDIRWKSITGTRDRIIHAYFQVDLDLIWDIIKKDLPLLKKQIERILKDSK